MLVYAVLCCYGKRSKMQDIKKILFYVIGHKDQMYTVNEHIFSVFLKNNRMNSSQGPSGFWKIKKSYKK
jgi:hypothetical protein